jgi:hypothetical protein
MGCVFRVLVLVLVFAVPGCAEGHEIRSMTGVDIALGEFADILYYVPAATAVASWRP